MTSIKMRLVRPAQGLFTSARIAEASALGEHFDQQSVLSVFFMPPPKK